MTSAPTSHRWVQKYVPRSVRNWVRKPIRSARYVSDRLAFACGLVRTLNLRQGWSVRCHPASRECFTVFQTDPAQAAELDGFVRHCRAGMQMLDVGAHHGLFALAALHYGGSGAKVLCVEASPAAALVLSANFRVNGFERRAEVIVGAMGGEDGVLEMLTTGPFADDYLVIPTGPRADTVTVPQSTMATILAKTGMAPTHVKMDIEGFEFEVLGAAQEVLASIRPVLFLEVHGDLLRDRGVDPEKLLGILRGCGYRRFSSGDEILSDADFRRKRFNLRVVCNV